MDEYIKKDDAIRAALKGASLHYHDQFGAVDIAAAIDELPTADVAPRAEVERLEAEKEAILKNYAECMKDYAREIFEEINAIKKEYASGDIDGNELYIRLYHLEKKYTEGEK